MQILFLYIVAVFFSKSLQSGAPLVESRSGSLSESAWSFKFSLFMRHFVGDILYVIDYERNILYIDVYMHKNITPAIFIKFNHEKKEVKLESLCGCNPCADVLVTLHVYEHGGKIYLTCKENRHINITKVNNNNRDNIKMDQEIKIKTEIKNLTHIYVRPTSKGCLHSFTYNGNPVRFKRSTSSFLASCPRDCRAGICNKGQCRMSDASGPPCDCSTTALNGPFCNKDLREFDITYDNSFEIIDADPNIKLKLSWKQFYDEKNCILQFVHGKISETLFVNGSKLMKGNTRLTKINKEINFLIVTIAQGFIEIKVNNEFIEKIQVSLKGCRIYIGFAKGTKQCETFKGIFDLEIEGQGYQKLATIPKSATMNWILVYCSSAIVILVVIVIIITMLARRSRKEFTENPYDNQLKVSIKKEKNMVDEDDYDLIYQDKLYGNTHDQKRNMLNCIVETPPLPPRNQNQ